MLRRKQPTWTLTHQMSLDGSIWERSLYVKCGKADGCSSGETRAICSETNRLMQLAQLVARELLWAMPPFFD
jgi:hypothetical protein